MNNTANNPMIPNSPTNNNPILNQDKKSFISKLYLDPIESLNNKMSLNKSKGFRIKKDYSKNNEEVGVSLPNMGMTKNNLANMNKTQGSVIIQNWETAKNIPKDIGDMIHFPVLVDRNKFKIKDDIKKGLAFTSTSRKFNFDKEKIRKDGEKLVKSIYVKENVQNLGLTMPTSYLSSQNTQNNFLSSFPTEGIDANKKIDRNLMTFQMKKKEPKDLEIITDDQIPQGLSTALSSQVNMAMTATQPMTPQIKFEPKKISKLIDFSTFNKHLYLKDNDFLYAKRVGGPVDYILCSYQDINQKSKISNNILQSMNKKKIAIFKKES